MPRIRCTRIVRSTKKPCRYWAFPGKDFCGVHATKDEKKEIGKERADDDPILGCKNVLRRLKKEIGICEKRRNRITEDIDKLFNERLELFASNLKLGEREKIIIEREKKLDEQLLIVEAMEKKFDKAKKRMIEMEEKKVVLRQEIEELEKSKVVLEDDLKPHVESFAGIIGKMSAMMPRTLRRCCVCYDAEPEFVFVGCGHFCLCGLCAGKIGDSCPQCRKKSELLKVY